MKKILALLLCTVLSVSFLTACGSTETTSQAPADGSEPATTESGGDLEPVTLTYACWSIEQEPALRAMADLYEEQNPHVTIEFQITSWDEYWTKLEAGATGGSMPDLMWMHVNVIDNYIDNNILQPINEDDTFSLSNYPESISSIYTRDGTIYAVPKDYDVVGLYYNKEIFDAKGVEYPTSEWTWDDLLATAIELNDPENNIYGFGAPQTNHQGYYSYIYQNGGSVVNADKTASGFDSAQTIEAVQFYYDMIFEHNVSPSAEQFAETEYRTMFQNGQLAMITMGSWSLGFLDLDENFSGKFDVAEIPAPADGIKATIANGLGHAVAASSENVEEAVKLAKFLGSKEANDVQGSFGIVIPAHLESSATWGENFDGYNVDGLINSIDYSVVMPATKSKSQWEKFEIDIMRNVYAGELTVEEGCLEIAEFMNEAIAEE